MTFFPVYKQLADYPFIDPHLPIHVSRNRIEARYPAHRHDFLECSFVISGSGQEWINGTAHEMRPGTFTFLLPYQIHEIAAAHDGPLILYNCMFDMNLLTAAFSRDEALTDLFGAETELPPFVHTDGELAERMGRLWSGLIEEYAGPPQMAWRHTLLCARLAELLAEFDRGRRGVAEQTGETERVHRSKRNIWPVIRHVHLHYRDPLSLTGLAELFGGSASRLSECVKEQIGLTFTGFLHEVRIRHACTLLLTTERSVLDIGYEVGFQSFKTFSRIFRELKGVPPSEYRRNGGLAPDGPPRSHPDRQR